jgi:NIF3 (NGG1p interacting factor 3)
MKMRLASKSIFADIIVTGMNIGRRRFARITGAAMLAGGRLAGQREPLTADQAIERIRKNAGMPWQTDTLDGIKAGDAATEITGIATTAMATMDMLNRAANAKTNLVVTLEPVFFGRLDAQPPAGAASPAGRGVAGIAPDDPIYVAKRQFIEKNRLVIFRFTDHWRVRKPDPFATGLAQTMNWTRYRIGDDPLNYEIPAITIEALATDLATRLRARAGIRVVGEKQTSVRRISLLPGVSALAATMKALPDCDLVLAGETREWESVEYAQDTVASGQKKGLIMLGRVLSQDPGMNVCAEWLKGVFSGTPVRWLPAGDPYWRPA